MNTYTAEQVYDALIRQGYSEEQAKAMALAIGGSRKSESEVKKGFKAVGATGADLPAGKDGGMDSPLSVDIPETIAFAGVNHLMRNKFKPVEGQGVRNLSRGAGRFLPGALAMSAAGMLSQAATGNNFFDRASTPQLLGNVAGNLLGDAVGSRAVSGLAGKLAGAAGGRLGGAAIGSALGPIGGIIGGLLGGYLIPKLLPDGSKSVEDEDKSGLTEKEAGWGTLGALAAGGALAASPGARKKAMELLKKPFSSPLGETTATKVNPKEGPWNIVEELNKPENRFTSGGRAAYDPFKIETTMYSDAGLKNVPYVPKSRRETPEETIKRLGLKKNHGLTNDQLNKLGRRANHKLDLQRMLRRMPDYPSYKTEDPLYQILG